MKEEMIRDSKRELQNQILNTLHDWTYFLGADDILDHLQPGSLKRKRSPITSIPVPNQLQPLHLPNIGHARAHVANQLNFLLSIRHHINLGQVFAPEQIQNYGPKYQHQIQAFKKNLSHKLDLLNREELECQGLLQDTEILKRYIAQNKLSLEEIKHRLEQRKLNRLLQ